MKTLTKIKTNHELPTFTTGEPTKNKGAVAALPVHFRRNVYFFIAQLGCTNILHMNWPPQPVVSVFFVCRKYVLEM